MDIDVYQVTADLAELMLKHGLTSALLVIPVSEVEFSLVTANVEHEQLRQLGHMLRRNIPDARGPLH